MYDLPGLFGLPIIATLVLGIFLTFWVLIVVCLVSKITILVIFNVFQNLHYFRQLQMFLG